MQEKTDSEKMWPEDWPDILKNQLGKEKHFIWRTEQTEQNKNVFKRNEMVLICKKKQQTRVNFIDRRF